MTWRAGLIAAVLGLAACVRADAAPDAYFVAVFGAQRPDVKLPRFTHSFAVFAHLRCDGRLEAFTISWMPRTGEMRPFWPAPEEGHNFDLYSTLRWIDDNNLEASVWGPYQCDPDLWRRALYQKTRLESGQVLYKAIDGGSPDGQVSNCIHAVEILARRPDDQAPKVIVAPANWGESGSYWVALALRPWYVEPCRTHDWLLARLGVNPDALIRRGLDENPDTNPLTRAVQAAFHPDLLDKRLDCGR